MSEGTEMNIFVDNGKSQFVDNLFAWAKSFHNGRKFYVNIARVAIRFHILDEFCSKNIHVIYLKPTGMCL